MYNQYGRFEGSEGSIIAKATQTSRILHMYQQKTTEA